MVEDDGGYMSPKFSKLHSTDKQKLSLLENRPRRLTYAKVDGKDENGLALSSDSREPNQSHLALKVKLPGFLLSRDQYYLLNEPQLRNFVLQSGKMGMEKGPTSVQNLRSLLNYRLFN